MVLAGPLLGCSPAPAPAADANTGNVRPPDASVDADGSLAPDAFTGPIGGDRPVSVYVPPRYQPGEPTPLVMLLHGYSTSGELQEWYMRFMPLAESRGFLYAHPDGLVDRAGQRYWNATDACCDHWDVDNDDSSYLRRVIDDIKAVYTVDPRQVYLIGYSNGGFMAHRLACDHADTIAAIASVAGVQWSDIARCQPSEPVAVLQIHGTADVSVEYDGGDIFGTPYPGAPETVDDWRNLNHCSTPGSAGDNMDLEASIPGAETDVLRYDTDCTPGGHAELWTIHAGSHTPVFTESFGSSVIDFLFAHPKP